MKLDEDTKLEIIKMINEEIKNCKFTIAYLKDNKYKFAIAHIFNTRPFNSLNFTYENINIYIYSSPRNSKIEIGFNSFKELIKLFNLNVQSIGLLDLIDQAQKSIDLATVHKNELMSHIDIPLEFC